MGRRQELLLEEFQSLITRISPQTLGWLRLNLRHYGSDLAEDIFQQACLKACRALDFFRGESTLETWFRTIVARELLQYIRKEKRSCLVYASQEVHAQNPIDDGLGEKESIRFVAKSNQYECVLLREVRECVRKESNRSSPSKIRQKQAIAEMMLEGLGPNEISERLGIGVECAKATIYRLRLLLYPKYYDRTRASHPDSINKPKMRLQKKLLVRKKAAGA